MDNKSYELTYHHIEGKTYTLFGNTDSTAAYYQTIRSIADKILHEYDMDSVLKAIKKYSPKKEYLRQIIKKSEINSLISFCLISVHDELKQFTLKTSEHLKNLSPLKFWDRRISTTEEQYHLYMLEIEITNRKNKIKFLQCKDKISLHPYCLRDLSVTCKAVKNEFDYQCRSCSKTCYQNNASRILKEYNIKPYIWMGASINKPANEANRNGGSFGILGIACIPELVYGIRRCMSKNIPVVGIPLNANRCIRWFGEFRHNSVDLNELENLIKN